MKKILFLLLPLFSLTLANVHAQKAWSLEECIDYALQNNLQIKRQQLAADVAEADLIQSKYALLPNLNARFSHNLSSGRALNTETYTWENRSQQDGSLGAGSDLTLFNGLQNFNAIKRNRFDLMRDLANVDKIKNDISLNIATFYLQILFAYELLDLAKNQKAVTLQQTERVAKLVEVGNKAKGELLEIKAQLANDNLNVTNAENNLKISYLDLIQLLELELDSIGSFKIERPVLPDLPVEEFQRVNDIFSEAMNILPQIRSAEYNMQGREKALCVAKGARFPDLSLGGYYYTRYNNVVKDPLNPMETYNYIDQIKDNQYRQLSLDLSIPIFNRRVVESGIIKSKIALINAEYELEQTKKNLYKDVQQAHSDATAAFEKYRASIQAVESNTESFNYTRQKYEVGLVNSVDFNIAKNDLSKATSNLLQAKYEYIFKLKILDFYLGKKIII
ncbi:MAG: TolC family protein [Bacteroidales bacterium]